MLSAGLARSHGRYEFPLNISLHDYRLVILDTARESVYCSYIQVYVILAAVQLVQVSLITFCLKCACLVKNASL